MDVIWHKHMVLWQRSERTYPKPLSNSNAGVKLCGTYHVDKDEMLSDEA